MLHTVMSQSPDLVDLSLSLLSLSRYRDIVPEMARVLVRGSGVFVALTSQLGSQLLANALAKGPWERREFTTFLFCFASVSLLLQCIAVHAPHGQIKLIVVVVVC